MFLVFWQTAHFLQLLHCQGMLSALCANGSENFKQPGWTKKEQKTSLFILVILFNRPNFNLEQVHYFQPSNNKYQICLKFKVNSFK